MRLHGSIWEYLVAIDIIKKYLTKAKTNYLKSCHTRFLGIAINTKLSLAQKYYRFIIKDLIYAAAIVFNSMQKWHYFNAK